mmetsp:Transcript_4281/g.10197  ORF Transcript_4281/g.10197 Transcript_4281/m.10197 type:complete len:245 (+) Transcript_4281:280-1014(+)
MQRRGLAPGGSLGLFESRRSISAVEQSTRQRHNHRSSHRSTRILPGTLSDSFAGRFRIGLCRLEDGWNRTCGASASGWTQRNRRIWKASPEIAKQGFALFGQFLCFIKEAAGVCGPAGNMWQTVYGGRDGGLCFSGLRAGKGLQQGQCDFAESRLESTAKRCRRGRLMEITLGGFDDCIKRIAFRTSTGRLRTINTRNLDEAVVCKTIKRKTVGGNYKNKFLGKNDNPLFENDSQKNLHTIAFR